MESFTGGSEKSKQEKWDTVAQKIERTVDVFDKHLDEGVKETVIALKAHDFGTIGSCEGHLDRGLPYPWVDVGSQLAEENNHLDSRFSKLWKRYRAEKLGGDKISDEEKVELQNMIKVETEVNAEALNRLTELLNEFNELDNSKDTSLVLGGRYRNRARLRPSNVPTGQVKVIRKELAKLSNDELNHNLQMYREEMAKFTEFLRDRFFT